MIHTKAKEVALKLDTLCVCVCVPKPKHFIYFSLFIFCFFSLLVGWNNVVSLLSYRGCYDQLFKFQFHGGLNVL